MNPPINVMVLHMGRDRIAWTMFVTWTRAFLTYRIGLLFL